MSTTGQANSDIFYVGVFCDHGACEADETADYLAYDREHAFTCLRRDLRAQGWRCDDTGDWCREHTGEVL